LNISCSLFRIIAILFTEGDLVIILSILVSYRYSHSAFIPGFMSLVLKQGILLGQYMLHKLVMHYLLILLTLKVIFMFYFLSDLLLCFDLEISSISA
jgi:hypothetical protein